MMAEKFDLEKWKEGRTRVGEVQMVTVGKSPEHPGKNAGLPDGSFENDHLHCICTKCDCTYQGECEFNGNCDCCSGTCD